MSSPKKKKNAKRVGYVELTVRYAVDLDDKDMVAEAKDCIYEDVSNMVKHEEISAWIEVCKPDQKLRETDIPDFLLESAETRQRRKEDEEEGLRRDKKRGLYLAEIDDAN